MNMGGTGTILLVRVPWPQQERKPPTIYYSYSSKQVKQQE